MAQSVSVDDNLNGHVNSYANGYTSESGEGWVFPEHEVQLSVQARKELTLKKRFEIRRKIEAMREQQALSSLIEDYCFNDL